MAAPSQKDKILSVTTPLGKETLQRQVRTIARQVMRFSIIIQARVETTALRTESSKHRL